MTKQCAHCGGRGYCDDGHPLRTRYRCDHCGGTGKTDDAEYEPEICPGCGGNGCGRCKGTGEVWRKVESETTKEVDE